MLASLVPLVLSAQVQAVRIEGKVEYSGTATGPILLRVWTREGKDAVAQVTLEAPGPFSIEASSTAEPQVFAAFLDADGDGRWDLREPSGLGRRRVLEGGREEIEISLQDSPAGAEATEGSPPREISIDARKGGAAITIDGVLVGRGFPVPWVQGKSARVAAIADLLPAAAGPTAEVRVRAEGGAHLLGPASEDPAVATFPDLDSARMAALLEGDFRIERRTVGGVLLGIAIERGAGLPEEEILRAAEGSGAFLVESFPSRPSFLPIVLLGGSGEISSNHGAPIARLDPAAPQRAVARALAEAWIRTYVPDAASDERLRGAAEYLGLLSQRASGNLAPEEFLAPFEPGSAPTLALLLDTTIRDALDGERTLATFLGSLGPAARRGGGLPIPTDWDSTLDFHAGFDLSATWRRVLEEPRGPLADFLLGRGGLRFLGGKDGSRALVRHPSASSRAAALRETLLREGKDEATSLRQGNSWFADLAGTFEGTIAASRASGEPGPSTRIRLSLRPGERGPEGFTVALAPDGSPLLGTLAAVRFEAAGERIALVERLSSGEERRAEGGRTAGVLNLVERDGEGALARWERWRILFEEIRLERWTHERSEPLLETARLRRR
jgi:hypothetical protein